MALLWSRTRHRLAARGFTLIELLTVVVILAILASVAVGFAHAAQERGRVARCRAELAHLALGLENFKRSFGGYPPSEPEESPDSLYSALTDYPGRSAQERRRPFVDAACLTIVPQASVTNANSLSPDPAFVDPWGNRYLYRRTGRGYLLLSAGPDGRSSPPEAAGGGAGRRAAAIDADNVFADEPP